ncbi:MAG TPA: PilZ domain-containing protein [Burkholderiaceae bacterium]|jgi:hypothetical protein|nr:PilZ domain-containing protein [Burkholderiaceae bacterium]
MATHALNPKEQRTEERKTLRCAATITSAKTAPLLGRTVDISLHGVSIMLPKPMNVGEQFTVSFDTMTGNKIHAVKASARVTYCICVGTSGFRSGFQFAQLDEKSIKIIKDLMQPAWM